MALVDENIFDIINRFRESAPVDVERLTRALGLQLNYSSLDKNIAGMIEKSGNSYLVTVNKKDAETRQRFTIAHELGHYVHHRDKIGDGVADSRMYRNTGAFDNKRIGATQESQANQFAANLLMPFALISKLQAAGVNTPDELAASLGVSRQAMHIRLEIPYSA